MNIILKFIYKLMANLNIDIRKDYKKVRMAQEILSPGVRLVYKQLDQHFKSKDGSMITLRVFENSGEGKGTILFFHGGGWVIGDIDFYINLCTSLQQELNRTVISVDYRLAPEYPYPKGFEDCYTAFDLLCKGELDVDVDHSDVVVMGDSAGGNLAAAVCLKRRDEGLSLPSKQVLIYPATCWNHDEETSPFDSVRENGEDYGLTSQRVEEYMSLYAPNIEDRKSPYVAPLEAEDFSHQPETLVITAEFDPLRDEGEEYAKRLGEAENKVVLRRIDGAAHGFITLPAITKSVKEAFEEMKRFLGE